MSSIAISDEDRLNTPHTPGSDDTSLLRGRSDGVLSVLRLDGPAPSTAVVAASTTAKAIRIGGQPTSRSRIAGDHNIDQPALQALVGEIADLRRKIDEKAEVDEASLSRLGTEIDSVKESIQYVEAFVSVSLTSKLDEAFTTKLTAVRAMEVSGRRRRFWLCASLVANLALGSYLGYEMGKGSLAPGFAAWLSEIAGEATIAAGDVLRIGLNRASDIAETIGLRF